MSSDDPISNPRCPRCGYELRGVVAAWEESCPLEGVCSECGFALRWAEVLRPERFAPRWCVEFARSRHDVLGACIRTLTRSYRPWRFWTGVRMAFPVRGRRLAAYVLFLLAPFLLGYIIEQTAVAVVVRQQFALDLREHQKEAPQVLQYLTQRAQSEGWEQLSGAEREFYVLHMDLLKEEIRLPTVLHHSYPAAVLEAIFLPIAKTSTGTLDGDGSGSVAPYPAPRRLHRRVERLLTGRRGEMLPWPGQQLPYFGWWLLIYALLPLCFLALPASRRRAKVRWRHLVRIAVYGLHIPATIALAAGACFVLALTSPASAGLSLTVGSLLILVVMLPWILMWWIAAIDRHLRMEHSAAVTIAVVAMALLASTAIVYVLNDELVFVPLSRILSGF